jgi:hypothetical protein
VSVLSKAIKLRLFPFQTHVFLLCLFPRSKVNPRGLSSKTEEKRSPKILTLWVVFEVVSQMRGGLNCRKQKHLGGGGTVPLQPPPRDVSQLILKNMWMISNNRPRPLSHRTHFRVYIPQLTTRTSDHSNIQKGKNTIQSICNHPITWDVVTKCSMSPPQPPNWDRTSQICPCITKKQSTALETSTRSKIIFLLDNSICTVWRTRGVS